MGLAGEVQGRLGLLPGFQQWIIRPFRRDGRIRIALVEVLDGVKRDSSRFAKNPIKRPRDLRAYCIRHKPLSSTFKNASHLALELDGAHSIVRYKAQTIAPGLTFVYLTTVP